MTVPEPTLRIGLIIPTLNAGPAWSEALAAIKSQSVPLRRKLVVDSTSTDHTVDLARAAGFEVLVIPRVEFNHGGTRQRAVEHLDDCDIVVFLTQDAILASEDSIAALARCFYDSTVALAYGRQLPHLGATPLEAHARLFNYGSATLRKDRAAIPRYGAKSFFCSNSFAAYRRTTLLQLGGFRRDLILAEDAEYAARAILAGYANIYCADATVRHSHDYSVGEQFARYFDLGVFEGRADWLRRAFGSHGPQGARYVASEIRYLWRHSTWQIPRSILQSLAKWLGYRLGTGERWLPGGLKRKLSMSPGYWK